MRTIDIHARLTPQSFWPADMAIDWPVSWVLSLESLTQEDKEAILWKNPEKLLGMGRDL